MKTLYGVGVGPGDPELLTLKAVRCIREAHYVFIPRPKPDKPGIAETIVQEYLTGKRVVIFHIPMGADNAERYGEMARAIDATLSDGKSGAFITLGDPLVYSTCTYTMFEARKLGIDTRIIPGIPSFTAVAAMLGIPLAVKDESVYLTDGHVDEAMLQQVHTVYILKPRRAKAETLEQFEKQGFQYAYVKHCSLPDEAVVREKDAILRDREYMSLLVAWKLRDV